MKRQTNKDFRQEFIKRSFDLAKCIIAFVDLFSNKRSAWVIVDQLIRAVTSRGANIIEAQTVSSRKNFINFFNHALKSGNETKFWLTLVKDLDPTLNDEIESLLIEVGELMKIIGSSIITLKTNNYSF